MLLVLATDVSNSVIKERWEVQRSGYAAAFANEDVQKALLSGARGAIGLCLDPVDLSRQPRDDRGLFLAS
jgi:hypothetical protein